LVSIYFSRKVKLLESISSQSNKN